MKTSFVLKAHLCAKILIALTSFAMMSCEQSSDGNGGTKPIDPSVTQTNFDNITFKGEAYEGGRTESITMQSASASVYRNNTDGIMKLSAGFVENSFSPNPCAQENAYSHNPSETNPRQRLFSIFNLHLKVGVKQKLTNENFWTDQTSIGGRVYFFDINHKPKEIANLYPGAEGDVTIVDLNDDSVTLQIDHFVARDHGSFTINGTVTVKICK